MKINNMEILSGVILYVPQKSNICPTTFHSNQSDNAMFNDLLYSIKLLFLTYYNLLSFRIYMTFDL